MNLSSNEKETVDALNRNLLYDIVRKKAEEIFALSGVQLVTSLVSDIFTQYEAARVSYAVTDAIDVHAWMTQKDLWDSFIGRRPDIARKLDLCLKDFVHDLWYERTQVGIAIRPQVVGGNHYYPIVARKRPTAMDESVKPVVICAIERNPQNGDIIGFTDRYNLYTWIDEARQLDQLDTAFDWKFARTGV